MSNLTKQDMTQIDKYEQRFGSNYNSNKRFFNRQKISISTMKRMCNNLDMTAILALKDKSPDVPNPMGGGNNE